MDKVSSTKKTWCYIVSRCDPRQCLDIVDHSMDEGAEAGFYPYHKGMSQHWEIRPKSSTKSFTIRAGAKVSAGPFEGSFEAEIPVEITSDYITLYNQESRKYLSCKWDKKYGSDVGTVVMSSKPFEWKIEHVYGNWFTISPKTLFKSPHMLDVARGGTTHTVFVWPFNQHENQHWRFIIVK
jgi:hypothetical protein